MLLDVQVAGPGENAVAVSAEFSAVRRPSSWIRRRARQRAEHVSDTSARQQGSATADALSGAHTADTIPSSPDEPLVSGQQEEAAAASEVRQRTDPLRFVPSDGDHCRGPDGGAQLAADAELPDLDDSIPGWVDLFGKDPPPGWPCSPLDEWDFGSASADVYPACAAQPARSQTMPEQGLPGEPMATLPLHPVPCRTETNRTQPVVSNTTVPPQQPGSARGNAEAAAAVPMRTPRGWRSPVDMLIPRGPSLYCSRYRRRYGLPNARAFSLFLPRPFGWLHTTTASESYLHGVAI